MHWMSSLNVGNPRASVRCKEVEQKQGIGPHHNSLKPVSKASYSSEELYGLSRSADKQRNTCFQINFKQRKQRQRQRHCCSPLYLQHLIRIANSQVLPMHDNTVAVALPQRPDDALHDVEVPLAP